MDSPANAVGTTANAAIPDLAVFLDADALFSGCASASGASRILLRLGELTLLRLITREQAVEEARRNLAAKLPDALPILSEMLAAARVEVVPDRPLDEIDTFDGQGHRDDLPILAAATHAAAHYLVTFNLRHYDPRAALPVVVTPGNLVGQIRTLLRSLVPTIP